MAIDRLTAIGWGLISFAIVVGLGMIVLTKFGDQVVNCAAIGGGAATWNTSTQLCQNASGTTAAGAGAAYTAISYVNTQMGSTGLTGWLSLIIVVLIAGLVLNYFRGGKGESY